MQTNKKNILFIISLLTISLLPACSIPNGPFEVALVSDSTGKQLNDSMAKRFQESSSQSSSAIEEVVQLSKQYAKLLDETTGLREKNQNLLAENKQFKERLDILESQSRQTEKELAQANDQLIETKIELNNWKVSIIGFRDEIRNAEVAQLRALKKIYEILGGQVEEKSTQNEEQSAPAQSSIESNQS